MTAAQEAHFGKLISIRKFSGAIVSPLAVRPPHDPTPRQGRRADVVLPERDRAGKLPITQSAQQVLFLAERRELPLFVEEVVDTLLYL